MLRASAHLGVVKAAESHMPQHLTHTHTHTHTRPHTHTLGAPHDRIQHFDGPSILCRSGRVGCPGAAQLGLRLDAAQGHALGRDCPSAARWAVQLGHVQVPECLRGRAVQVSESLGSEAGPRPSVQVNWAVQQVSTSPWAVPSVSVWRLSHPLYLSKPPCLSKSR